VIALIIPSYFDSGCAVACPNACSFNARVLRSSASRRPYEPQGCPVAVQTLRSLSTSLITSAIPRTRTLSRALHYLLPPGEQSSRLQSGLGTSSKGTARDVIANGAIHKKGDKRPVGDPQWSLFCVTSIAERNRIGGLHSHSGGNVKRENTRARKTVHGLITLRHKESTAAVTYQTKLPQIPAPALSVRKGMCRQTCYGCLPSLFYIWRTKRRPSPALFDGPGRQHSAGAYSAPDGLSSFPKGVL
jgi:hypothetical protein